MTVAVGRFGPYVRHAGKFYSLPKDTDPLSCTAEQAIEIIREKRESEEKSLLKSFAEDADLSIRTGRFGPYLKYKTDNYKLPKDVDPTSMSYDDCMSSSLRRLRRRLVGRSSPSPTSPRLRKSEELSCRCAISSL